MIWPFSRKKPEDDPMWPMYLKAKEKMRPPLLVKDFGDGMKVWHECKEVYHNNHGKMGFVQAIGLHGDSFLVHQITNDGKVSGSGPRWTKSKWFRHDVEIYALCEVCKADPGYSFGKNGVDVRTRISSIIMMPSEFVPKMTFEQWKGRR